MAKLKADLLDGLTIKTAKSKEEQYALPDANGWFTFAHHMAVSIFS